MNISVVKNSGQKERFDEDKLQKSLLKAGASHKVAREVTDYINSNLFDSIPTSKLYSMAYEQLSKLSSPNAGKYKLKNALFELGPSGYPFEKYINELFKCEGYETITNVHVQGKCIIHEIDVVAENENEHFMIECKFHSKVNSRCNVKTPLYVQARFLDIKQSWELIPGHNKKDHHSYIVTNTKFTRDALEYGGCVGLRLLSWNYPQNNSLKDKIEQFQLHPITCLSTLKKNEIKTLMDLGFVLCKDLRSNAEILDEIKIDPQRHEAIINESRLICSSIIFQ